MKAGTAVSIMSNNGVPLQDIADTVGHRSTHVTETVYRHVLAAARIYSRGHDSRCLPFRALSLAIQAATVMHSR